jgi:hypothetical protein
LIDLTIPHYPRLSRDKGLLQHLRPAPTGPFYQSKIVSSAIVIQSKLNLDISMTSER